MALERGKTLLRENNLAGREREQLLAGMQQEVLSAVISCFQYLFENELLTVDSGGADRVDALLRIKNPKNIERGLDILHYLDLISSSRVDFLITQSEDVEKISDCFEHLHALENGVTATRVDHIFQLVMDRHLTAFHLCLSQISNVSHLSVVRTDILIANIPRSHYVDNGIHNNHLQDGLGILSRYEQGILLKGSRGAARIDALIRNPAGAHILAKMLINLVVMGYFDGENGYTREAAFLQQAAFSVDINNCIDFLKGYQFLKIASFAEVNQQAMEVIGDENVDIEIDIDKDDENAIVEIDVDILDSNLLKITELVANAPQARLLLECLNILKNKELLRGDQGIINIGKLWDCLPYISTILSQLKPLNTITQADFDKFIQQKRDAVAAELDTSIRKKEGRNIDRPVLGLVLSYLFFSPPKLQKEELQSISQNSLITKISR